MSSNPLTPLGLPASHPLAGLPSRVVVYEVGARDGLQAEAELVPTRAKVAFIESLAAAGLPMVEATSFVSPKWVPQLADAAEVLEALRGDGHDLALHPVLVPNQRGLDLALKSGAKTLAVFVSTTETFAQRNLNTTVGGALDNARAITTRAREAGLVVRGYVSMCFGDPWEGPVPVADVAAVSRELVDMGCYEVSLGDTIGVGTAGHVRALLDAHVVAGVPLDQIAMHFHDTYGQALTNVLSALQAGVTTFDASAGGIGGCPYARSASGNLATEDLLWMLHGLGIETSVDFDAVVATAAAMTKLLGRPSPSRVAQALARC